MITYTQTKPATFVLMTSSSSSVAKLTARRWLTRFTPGKNRFVNFRQLWSQRNLPGLTGTSLVLLSSAFMPSGMHESGSEGAPILKIFTSENLTSKE
jgi:ABC-type glycerol-3-phosphate transport system permease component